MVKRWALLCGGDHYVPGTARAQLGESAKKPPNLKGCVRDVQVMKRLLLDEFNMPEANIRMLTSTTPPGTNAEEPGPLEPSDRWPTWANIKRELEEIESEANTGGNDTRRLLYFHYSGHGTLRRGPIQPSTDDDNDDVDFAGACLVPTDAAQGGAYLTARQLGRWIQRMVVQSGFRATVVLDSCYSGGGFYRHDDHGTPRTLDYTDDTISDQDNTAESQADEWTHDNEDAARAGEVSTCWFSDPKGCTVVTACSRKQTAAERIFDGNPHGVLTHHLVALLRKSRRSLLAMPSHWRAVHHIRQSTTPDQIPMLYGEGLFEFFGLDEYTQVESSLAWDNKDGTFRIDIGFAQGVVVGAVYDVAPSDFSTAHAAPEAPRPVKIEVTEVMPFTAYAKVVDTAAHQTWPAAQTGGHATLRQWALKSEVFVEYRGKPEDMDRLEVELRGKPGLELRGARSGAAARDLVVTLDQGSQMFEIRQHDAILPRIPLISYVQPNWPAELARVLSHVSRFQALQHQYDDADHPKLPKDKLEIVPDPDQVEDGGRIKLKLLYHGSISWFYVSLYCFSASWGITREWPHPSTGKTAELQHVDDPPLVRVPPHNIIMTVPPQCRRDDPNTIEDRFFFFLSTVTSNQVPSWGDICLPELTPTGPADPVEWPIPSTNGDDKRGGKVADEEQIPDWNAISGTVRTTRQATPIP